MSKSLLESQLDADLRRRGITAQKREYPFKGLSGDRRYRFDFAFPTEKVAVEVQGGIWSGGRHTRGKGFEEERSKSAQAQILGWKYIEVTPSMIRSGEAVDLIEQALGRH